MGLAITKTAWLKAFLGIAISGWVIYLSVVRFDWPEVWTQITEVQAGVLVLAVVCYLAGFVLRAWRASLMIETMSATSTKDSLAIVTIGYAGNNLFPFRMGELMRADAAARIYGIHRGAAIVQVTAERILDAMAIVAILIVSLFFVSVGGSRFTVISDLAKLAVVGFVIGLLSFIVVVHYGSVIKKRLSGRGYWAEWISQRLIDTLSCLNEGRRLAQVMLLSLLIWFFEAGSFSILAVHWGMENYIATGCFVMGVVNLSVLLPSAPGHIGVYHWAVVLALGVLLVPEANAMSFAITIHALQWCSITVIGVFFMLSLVKRSGSNETVLRAS